MRPSTPIRAARSPSRWNSAATTSRCACATAASASPPRISSGCSSRSRKSRNPLANASSGLGLGLSLVRRDSGAASWRHQGHQRRSRDGERVCRLAPVLMANNEERSGSHGSGGSAASARHAEYAEGADRRRSRGDRTIGRASRPHVGSRGRHRQRRPECPRACGVFSAGMRHRRSLIARDERDRARPSSAGTCFLQHSCT